MKKIVAVILALTLFLLIPATSFAGYNAPKLTPEEWDKVYNAYCKDNTLPALNVGADQTQVNLCWHADAAKAKPEVRLAKNAAMTDYKTFKGNTTPAETEDQLVCRVTVTGLEEKTTYYYQYHTGKGWSKAYKYETKSFGDHVAMVIGDIQIGGQTEDSSKQSLDGYTWNNVLATALADRPDIAYLVSPGDNTSTGKTADEWQTLLMPSALRSLPTALAIGNHDKKGFAYNYYNNLPNEFYGEYFEGLDRDFWFRYGDVLYLFFDATSSCAADHMAMAKEAVEANPDAKWRIGIMHQALFGPGFCMFSTETMLLLNAVFTPIFDTYDVDLVLTGHSHMQGRSHFMYESSVVGLAKSGKTYTNPLGTVYLNTNAICDQTNISDEYGDIIGSFKNHYTAFYYSENEVTTYTTLDFSGDTLKIETKRGDNAEVLDSLTIKKTNDKHFDNLLSKKLHRLAYKFVELCGIIYQEIDRIVVAYRGGHF